MSLRRRITGAVAIGVAAVVLVLAGVVYLSVRSHLRNEIDNALVQRAQQQVTEDEQAATAYPQIFGGPGGILFIPPSGGGGRPPAGGGGHRPPRPGGDTDLDPPGADPFGGAPGYFQYVYASGQVIGQGNAAARVPVSASVLAVAKAGSGHAFSEQTVKGQHLRIYTEWDPPQGYAVEVARPLSEVDSVLHQLLYTFAAVILGGILLAIAMGAFIGRAALAPIGRFVRRTEAVTGALDGSERLEEGDAAELARLASSFNRTLDALEASVASQRHLVADASHELRTPISALRSNVQIFLESDRLPVEDRVGLQTSILAELDELTQLVDDVLELGRGAAAPDSIEELRLDTIVSEAIERTQRRAPELRFDAQLEPTTIRQVPERVGRAVINLLDNARKWSTPDGAIDVRLADGVLEVRDHGPGFVEADLPHVFDRFYRAERSRTMAGSGLGLAIVSQTAKAGGGFVEAANAPGGGAIVRASFGAAIVSPSAAPA
jgi:two-component system sensor histidine kinase MprB